MKNKINSENRREFLQKAGLLFGAGAAFTSLSSLIVSCEHDEIPAAPPANGTVNISLSDYPDLMNVGGIAKVTGKVVGSSSTATFDVRRISDTEFVALETTCPHLGADLLLPATGKTRLVCPLHSAEFSTDKADAGVAVANPSNISDFTGATPKKLKSYTVDITKLSTGVIVISLS